MNSEEVVDKIQEAINAINEYRISKLKQKYASRKDILKKKIEENIELYDETDILNEAKKLIKEAYILGQSGNVCPTCGGSGRV